MSDLKTATINELATELATRYEAFVWAGIPLESDGATLWEGDYSGEMTRCAVAASDLALLVVKDVRRRARREELAQVRAVRQDRDE